MKGIFQNEEHGCGVACVAMLSSISYAKARRICGDAYDPSDGICEKPMLHILERQGFRIVSRGRITLAKPVTSLKRDALLWGHLLPSRATIDRDVNVCNHWALWDYDAQAIRDPYRYKKPMRLTKFFEVAR
jgi:hypothetical protein